MNRRKFLGTGATAGIALIASPYAARRQVRELLVAGVWCIFDRLPALRRHRDKATSPKPTSK